MPGMSTGLRSSNPTIVSAFQTRLLHQGLVVLVILMLLVVAWNVLRAMQLRQSVAIIEGTRPVPTSHYSYPEPPARRLLRISFGLIWIFDGILQGQASMPLGMITQVLKPTAAASPPWVHHVVDAGITIWGNHPIAASVSAVWIQVGLGAWLLVAPRGAWSRVGGLASTAWGLVVWVFGEGFGGIFSPGLTWLFGAPGAVLFYSVAGVLIALPERRWASFRLGRTILTMMGSFFIGMAILQAWPGRGFWQGHLPNASSPGTLTGMVQAMSRMSQPGFLASWVASFASFESAHGFAVNLFVVVALSAIGTAFVTGRPTLAKAAVVSGLVLCIADWVLVEDLGFLGGVGTDPNSMLPMALIFSAGYLAMTRAPLIPATVESGRAESSALPWRARLAERPTYVFRVLAATGAIGITLLGTVPMAVALMNSKADPILAHAIQEGSPMPTRTVGSAGAQSSRLVQILARTFTERLSPHDA